MILRKIGNYLGIGRKNLKEVFKTGGTPQYTYIQRSDLYAKIRETLSSREKGLLFLGYSKSGKTVFRKNVFEGKKVVVFRCNRNSTISNLYNSIASELNLGQIVSSGGTRKSSATTGAGVSGEIPGFGNANASTSRTEEYGIIETREHAKVKVDVNFLCNAIENKENLIIAIEDYHLVPTEFNEVLSEDLKHFHDEEITFLIIGIPSTTDRTLKNNPDLSGRLEKYNFDYLSDEDALELMSKGEEAMNIKFSDSVKEAIIEFSLRNIYLVQFICQKLLENAGILRTSRIKYEIDDVELVRQACKDIANVLNSDYKGICEIISGGGRRQKDGKVYNQYDEILDAITRTPIERLEKGLSHLEINALAHSKFSEEEVQLLIDNGTYKNADSFKSALGNQIRQAVERVEANLDKNSARPIIIVNEKTIYVMDLIFKFYLNWI